MTLLRCPVSIQNLSKTKLKSSLQMCPRHMAVGMIFLKMHVSSNCGPALWWVIQPFPVWAPPLSGLALCSSPPGLGPWPAGLPSVPCTHHVLCPLQIFPLPRMFLSTLFTTHSSNLNSKVYSPSRFSQSLNLGCTYLQYVYMFFYIYISIVPHTFPLLLITPSFLFSVCSHLD